MTELLDVIRGLAAPKLSATPSVEELQAAATLAKTIAEAEKASIDARNNRRQLHLERLKSWSALLVPIVSLLALVGTVITQTIQLRQQFEASRQQSEAAEWRDLLASLRGPAATYASDITVSSRLQAFLRSDRYKEDARDLATRIMGNLTNMSSFVELYNATARDDAPGEIKRILRLAGALTSAKTSIESECNAESPRPDLYFGICTFSLPDKDVIELAKLTKDSNAAMARRRALQALSDELNFVSGHIANYLRRNYEISAAVSGQTLDLSFVLIMNADLSRIDFSKFENVRLQLAKLDGAILASRGKQRPEFWDSEWWKAAAIEEDLLKFLVEYRYPYHDGALSSYPDGEPKKEEYVAHIKRLCVPARSFCNGEMEIKFGTRSP